MPIFEAAAKHSSAVASVFGHCGPGWPPEMVAVKESLQPPPVSFFWMRVVSGHSSSPEYAASEPLSGARLPAGHLRAPSEPSGQLPT